MNARALVEALFRTGAAFIDTSKQNWLTTTGTVYMPMDTGRVGDAVYNFIEFWSRGKARRTELLAEPDKAFQAMVDRHGLVAVFATSRGVAVVSAGGRLPLLDNTQIQWLLDRLPITPNAKIILAPGLTGGYAKVDADVLFFGKPERRRDIARRQRDMARPTSRPKNAPKWKERSPEDEEFEREVSKFQAAQPQFSGVEAPEITPRTTHTPKVPMRFIKGGGANVVPTAVMRGVA